MKFTSGLIENEITKSPGGIFSRRKYICLPNAYWGLGFQHEIDLLVISSSGLAYEIEIKISVVDFRNDKDKRKWQPHSNDMAKLAGFFYVLPKDIYDKVKDEIPEEHGVIVLEPYINRRNIEVIKQTVIARPKRKK